MQFPVFQVNKPTHVKSYTLVSRLWTSISNLIYSQVKQIKVNRHRSKAKPNKSKLFLSGQCYQRIHRLCSHIFRATIHNCENITNRLQIILLSYYYIFILIHELPNVTAIYRTCVYQTLRGNIGFDNSQSLKWYISQSLVRLLFNDNYLPQTHAFHIPAISFQIRSNLFSRPFYPHTHVTTRGPIFGLHRFDF